MLSSGPSIYHSVNLQVGVPYLRAKAQDYYEELGGGVSSDVLDDAISTRQLQALIENVLLFLLYWPISIIGAPPPRLSRRDLNAASK